MTAWRLLAAACGSLPLLAVCGTSGTALTSPDADRTFSGLTRGLNLAFVDDFDGPAGQPPDPNLWNLATGGGGWGNHEQQVYTADPANVRLDGDGHLLIEARNDGGQLSSARIDTNGKVELVDGVAAARIKLPRGQGLHPAFWMLGTSLDDVGYPGCGEIDVAETVNDASHAYFSLHGPMADGTKWKLSHYVTLPDLSQDFHTYWVAKQFGRLEIGIDETPLAMFKASEVPKGGRWVQNIPFFVLLNVAVAGEWPGPVDPNVLPAQMVVDSVKFWE